MHMTSTELDIKTLENWLWDAACKIRGEVDAPKYKDYILPLIFLKRLSDVFDDEEAVQQFKNGRKRAGNKVLNPKRSKIFCAKSNCETAS